MDGPGRRRQFFSGSPPIDPPVGISARRPAAGPRPALDAGTVLRWQSDRSRVPTPPKRARTRVVSQVLAAPVVALLALDALDYVSLLASFRGDGPVAVALYAARHAALYYALRKWVLAAP